jgi:WD40 repeat protein
MPLSCRCPGCQAPYELPDHLAGKRVRCKKCQATFPVPARARPKVKEEEPLTVEAVEEEPLDAEPAGREDRLQTAPRPRGQAAPPRTSDRRRPDERDDRPRGGARERLRRREEEDEDREASGQGTSTGLILGIAGGVLLLLLVGIGLGLWFILSKSPQTTPAVAENAVPPGGPVENKPVENKPDLPPQPGPRPQPQPRPRPQPGDPPAPAVAVWRVQPDPLKDAPAAPADKPPPIPLQGALPTVLFPTSFSPLVAVGNQRGANKSFEVWNLQTGQRVGTVGIGGISSDEVLSPDGAYLAAKLLGPTSTIEVLSVADGRSVRIDVENKIVHLHPSDFAGPGQLLTAKAVGADTLFQVWDIGTGNAVRQFQAQPHPDSKMRAFSPGRKYLAFPNLQDQKVLIYDLTTGERAGEAAVPAGLGFLSCKALAFSPDSKTLAGLFQAPGKGQFITWDVATGQATPHEMEKDPQFQAQNAFGYQGRPLEWLPDGSALLAYGQLLLDPKTGKVLWTLPRENADATARRVIGGDRLACVKGNNKAKALVLETLPKDKLDAATQAVRAGRDPSATVLPPATPADWSAVRNLPPPAGAAPWKAAPDPAPAPKGKLAAQPIPLQGRAGDLQRILFSGPDAAVAVVLTAAAADDLSPRKKVRADRYDLAGGQHLGGADLFAVELPKERTLTLVADASPDGARLAVKEPRDERRVDVWSVSDGKHVAGWLPYEKEADPKVRWIAFLDSGKVLTLGAGGKLVLWSLPECKAAWAATVRDVPALSPGRKLLAVHNGATFELLDATGGERVGQLGGGPVQNVLAAAFRGDGQELVAVVRADKPGAILTRWDLKAGKDTPGFPIFTATAELAWCAPGYVLYNETLIDTELKWPLSRCSLPGTGRLATGSPDGRLWFAYGQGPKEPAVLTAQALPDEGTRGLARQVVDGTIKPVLAPGMTVDVQVEIRGGRNPEAVRQRVRDALASRLQANGLTVAAGGAGLKLVIQMGPEQPTGQVMQLQEIGLGRAKTNVPIQQVACRAVLADARGAALWEQKQQFRTPDFIGIIRTQDPVADLGNALWNNCTAWGASLAVPTLVVRTAGGVEILPKPVTLRGDR